VIMEREKWEGEREEKTNGWKEWGREVKRREGEKERGMSKSC
jgi:hypothetical protein